MANFKYESTLLKGSYLDGLSENDYLQLNPISQITDEDIIEVCNILLEPYKRCEFHRFDHFEIKRFSEEIIITVENRMFDTGLLSSNGMEYHISFDGKVLVEYCDVPYHTYGDDVECNYLSAYQNLQSKGYALPFMGLSIKELINRGWLKLKTV